MANEEGQKHPIQVSNSSTTSQVTLAFVLPTAVALILGQVTGSLGPAGNSQTAVAPIFGGLGIVSWFLGLRWYGLRGIGLRGGRPLFAGIGFAFLGWLIFLALRFYFVRILGFAPAGAARIFIFLLLFEAFALQLWTFGLLFHALAAWRGPLTAAITSGIIFGAIAFLLFQESYIGSANSLLFFTIWGILYGIIRLRTGSLLGPVIIQTMQSFTAWVVMTPFPNPDASQLQSLYLFAGIAYVIVVWRLWPKEAGDYRV